MSEGPFRRVAIAGLGLIGGSIALRIRAIWPEVVIVGVDGSAETSAARHQGVIDDAAASVASMGAADLVVLAAPVPAIVDLLPQVAAAAPQALVTDVGSTKRIVMAAAAAAGMTRFVGGHPMAGSERGGLSEARADLFQGRPWMLVAGEGTGMPAKDRVEAFARAMGGTPQWIDPDTHDRVVAYISHVPQLLAVALMNATVDAVGDRGLSAAGRAFSEMTRLAASPADLWQGILAGNTDNIAEALRRVLAGLPGQTDLISGQWVKEAFSRAHASRARLPGAAAGEPSGGS